MKAILLTLFLCSIIVTTHAKPSLPCGEEGATPIDTFSVNMELQSLQGGSSLTSGAGSAWVSWEVIVQHSSSGQNNYVVNLGSISFTGDPTEVDNMTTGQIFTLIGQSTVAQGVALGHTPCPPSCTTPAVAEVRLPACVGRIGIGIGTYFQECDTNCCVRTYHICCPNGPGAPIIDLVSTSGPSCSGSIQGATCTSTCE